MKLQLTVALGLAVLATPAFATKARLQSLGEDQYGSAYINDNRNIWLNAAQVNNHRDLVTFETGTGGVVADAAATPRAEGGVYKQGGNLVYGVHLGGASNTSNGLRAAAGVNEFEENNLDLFVGGDTGLKWGANLGYTSSDKDETAGDAEQSALRTRLGVIMGDTQVYGNININNKAENTSGANEFEGKLGYQIGAIQAWNGYSIFVDYRSFDAEGDLAGVESDIKTKQLLVGVGRVTRLNDRSNLFTKVQFQMADAENERFDGVDLGAGGCTGLATGALCEEYKTTRLPITAGLETEATSWLTLRASLSQVVWGSEEGADSERGVGETTTVNAGATLKFGELAVDGVIGNNDGTSAGVGESTAAGTGTLRTDNLLTRVAMTYRF